MATWLWLRHPTVVRTESKPADEIDLVTGSVSLGISGVLIALLIAATIYAIHLLMIATNERNTKPILEDCHTVQECAASTK